MRPLPKLWQWHGPAGWEIRPFGDHVEFRQNADAPFTVALPRVQSAAQLMASLTAAAAGLQASLVTPEGFELPWPVLVADHGDGQITWAAHDREAVTWRPLPHRDAADPMGADLVGTTLGRAGHLAARFQMALAPCSTRACRPRRRPGRVPCWPAARCCGAGTWTSAVKPNGGCGWGWTRCPTRHPSACAQVPRRRRREEH
jgi:hypothetical protein